MGALGTAVVTVWAAAGTVGTAVDALGTAGSEGAAFGALGTASSERVQARALVLSGHWCSAVWRPAVVVVGALGTAVVTVWAAVGTVGAAVGYGGRCFSERALTSDRLSRGCPISAWLLNRVIGPVLGLQPPLRLARSTRWVLSPRCWLGWAGRAKLQHLEQQDHVVDQRRQKAGGWWPGASHASSCGFCCCVLRRDGAVCG